MQVTLVKIEGRLVRAARWLVLQLTEVAVLWVLFQGVLGGIVP